VARIVPRDWVEGIMHDKCTDMTIEVWDTDSIDGDDYTTRDLNDEPKQWD